MVNENPAENNFFQKLDKTIEANLSNDQFSVPQLAAELGMSRYTLHRKINAATKLSASQYIRQVRLKNALKLLREKSLSVSEVAYSVGFNSPIYFSKCFHEYFGYPPNTVGKREEDKSSDYLISSNKKRTTTILLSSILVLVLAIVLFLIIKPLSYVRNKSEKSVVVLFPVYNSSDSTYIHQINGTIDAILNNLSLVNDLTVFPMSTALKYKNSEKSGVEIAKELNAGYVIESSGFAYGDKVRLNIKLINAKEGVQVWYNPYDVDAKDIIKLPLEIAQKIAGEVRAEITPEEKKRIESVPTQNADAWNYFLQGRDILNIGLNLYYSKGVEGNEGYNKIKGLESFEKAIDFFKNALEYDGNFAQAYAQIAMTYYLLDIGNNDGKFANEINVNADLAILNDSQNDMCLLAKAYDYVNRGENKLAIPFLEKAIIYNPKSVISYRMLANIYNLTREPNTEKYLENKLMVINLTSQVEDSIQKSEDYRLAARALRVAGFNDEALYYIEKSIEMNPANFSSYGEKSEIIIEKDNDYIKARNILLDAFSKNTSNIEILRFLFTNHYLMKDYEGAYKNYDHILELDAGLSFLASKDYSRMTVIFDQLKMPKESKESLNKFREINRAKMNVYVKSTELLRLYSLENNSEKAIEQLNILSQQDCHFSYTIRMLKDDPVYDNIRDLPEFKEILAQMESKFRENHEKIKSNLKKKKLL